MRNAKKLFALALALCMIFLCTACSKNVSFKKYYKDQKYTDPYAVVSIMEKLDQFTDMSYTNAYNELIVFTGEEEWKVFNAKTNNIVATFKNDIVEPEIRFFSISGKTYFAACKLATISVYNDAGEMVATGSGTLDTFTARMDMFEAGTKIYRVEKDGKITTVNTNPLFGGIPSLSNKTDNYYYSMSGDSVTVYNKELETVYFWEAPISDVSETAMVMLGDNVLVQMWIPLNDTEDDYDCLIEGEKFDIESVIINPKKGKADSVKLDYVLAGSGNQDRVTVAMIKDRRVQDAPSARKVVSLNTGNGKIASEILSDLQGTVQMVAENRFLYNAYNGDSYLMDATGKIIGKVNELRNNSSRNANFIVSNGMVFDYDLKEVYVCINEEVESVMAHSVALRKTELEGGYKLLKKDGLTVDLPADAQEYSFNKQLCVLKYQGYFNFLNEEGTVIGNNIQGTSYSFVISGSDFSVVRVRNAGVYEYYKIRAAV